MSETSIEYLKRHIGLKITELADDMGALDESGTHEVNICIRNFRKAAAEWVYDLLKKTTKHYAKEGYLPEEEEWARSLVLLLKDI